MPAVVDKASDFHTQYALNLQELETIIEQCQAVTAETEDSDGELVDNEEASCISGSLDLGEDLNSRVQMLLDLIPTLESTLVHVERPQEQIAHTANE